MKFVMTVLIAELPAIVLCAGAVLMALKGVSGWGWPLAVGAFLASIVHVKISG
jgi:hypothetical protein